MGKLVYRKLHWHLYEGIPGRYLFDDFHQAQELLEWWRQQYNRYRPHSSLGYLTPEAFAEQARAANMLAGSAN